MEQNDFLLRQIDSFSYFLKKIVAELLKLKDKNPIESLNQIQQEFKNRLGIDLNELVNYPDSNFIEVLTKRKMTLNDKEYLAEILEKISEITDQNISKKYLSKALLVYENILNELKPNISLKIYSKIERLQKIIN